MMYWVFNQAQLEEALEAWMKREPVERFGPVDSTIRAFLASPEAKAAKLMGGASYPGTGETKAD